jgi:hypothetical protein
MISKRRNRGFQKAGSMLPQELGLPPKRSRELQLAVAWARVAGEAVSRCAPALRIHRGVLEVEAEDRRWLDTMREMMPRLAGRLAACYPELGIRKWRLLQEGRQEVAVPAERIPPA